MFAALGPRGGCIAPIVCGAGQIAGLGPIGGRAGPLASAVCIKSCGAAPLSACTGLVIVEPLERCGAAPLFSGTYPDSCCTSQQLCAGGLLGSRTVPLCITAALNAVCWCPSSLIELPASFGAFFLRGAELDRCCLGPEEVCAGSSGRTAGSLVA